MLLIYLILVSCSFCYGQLPPYVKPCKKGTNLGDCIKDNIEAVKPHMGKGVPALYLEPLNPWTYPSIKMKIPFLRFDIYDVFIWKMDTAVVKKVSLDEEVLEITYNIPYVWGECKYDVDGNLFLFRVNAEGYGNGSMTDIDFTLRLRGKPKVTNGKSYLDIEKSGFSWKINGGATVYFKDIFPGNAYLSNSFNKVANSRAVEFFNIIRPIMNFIYSDWVEKSVKGVFGNYPLEELFVA